MALSAYTTTTALMLVYAALLLAGIYSMLLTRRTPNAASALILHLLVLDDVARILRTRSRLKTRQSMPRLIITSRD